MVGQPLPTEDTAVVEEGKGCNFKTTIKNPSACHKKINFIEGLALGLVEDVIADPGLEVDGPQAEAGPDQAARVLEVHPDLLLGTEKTPGQEASLDPGPHHK